MDRSPVTTIRLQQNYRSTETIQIVEWRRQTRELSVCERLTRLMDTPQLALQAQENPAVGDDMPVWEEIKKAAEEAGTHTDMFLASLCRPDLEGGHRVQKQLPLF